MRILRLGCGLAVDIQSLSAPRSSLPKAWAFSPPFPCTSGWEQSALLSDFGPFSWHCQLEGALTGVGNMGMVMVTAS